ncbi:MAG: hypothetical protein J6S67_00135 [Methanobrevibacter sp.]|nr:hypothetical protein [Methanobrevibacter sp.]
MPYPYYQPYQYVMQQQPQNQQIQNGGFIMVKDVSEAMNYPLAPGNSVTFKHEGKPYIYTKTLGFSQLDQPVFEVFRLVKEDNVQETPSVPQASYLTQEDAIQMQKEINTLKEEVKFLRDYVEDERKEAVENV